MPETEGDVVPILQDWNMIDFTNSGIKLKLNFSNPELVSANYDKDTLQIKVVQSHFFLSISGYQYVEDDYTLKAVPVPPLCPVSDTDCENDNYTYLGRFMLFSLIPVLLIPFVDRMRMGRTWGLILTIQIVCNLVNYEKIVLPANVSKQLIYLDDISNLRITDNKALNDVISAILKNNDHFKEVFWGQGEFILSLWLFALLFIPTYLLWYFRPYEKAVQYMKIQLAWAPVYRASVLFYFTTALWALSYFKAGLSEDKDTSVEPSVRGFGNKRMLLGLTDRYVTTFTWSFIVIGLVKLGLVLFIPLYNKFFITKLYREGVLKYNVKVGMMVDRPYRWTQVTMGDFFFIRRLLLAFTTMWFNSYIVPSLYVIFYSSIFMISFQIQHKVFLNDWVYGIEMMNELFIFITGYFILFFTEWIPTLDVRYGLGSAYTDLIMIVVIINLLGVGALIHSELTR